VLPDYGVVVGTLDHFAREDPTNFGTYYHGKLYIQTPAGLYEGAVDVATPSGIKVQYRSLPSLDRTLFPLGSLTAGWHQLARNSTSGALDYVRNPLLHPRLGCLTFVFNPLIERLRELLNLRLEQWTDSTGDNALDELERVIQGSSRLFVFGAPYTTGRGVHDIHMNQGDPPGIHQASDGIWQDGGTLVEYPDGRLAAFLTKFETQTLDTNDQGLPK
jgi:uncharacterized protein YukJ